MKLAAWWILFSCLAASPLATAAVQERPAAAAQQAQAPAPSPRAVLKAPGSGPARNTNATRPAPTGPTVYVESAVIERISPLAISPGRPLMVTLRVYLATPIRQDDLISGLRVFIDSIAAPPRALAPAGAAASAPSGPAPGAGGAPAGMQAAAPSTSVATPREVGITLFVTAPADIASGRDLTLSVYSDLDRREIASMQVKSAAAEPAQAAASVPAAAMADALPGQNLVGGGVALALAVLGYYYFMRRQRLREMAVTTQRIEELESTVQVERRRISELARPQGSPPPPEITQAQGRPPVLPAELLDALARRELVVVLGAGASAQAGLPTSRTLWLNVLDRHAASVPPEKFERVQSLVATGSSESAAEVVVSLLGRETVLQALNAELLEGKAPARLHEKLAHLPLRAVIDMTWDDLMRRALAARVQRPFTPGRHEGIAETLREGKLALIKPLGYLQEPESVALTQREYRLALSKAPELERSLAALFTSRTLMFFGFSLDGLEQFLGSLPPQLDVADRRHFAVMPADAGVADLWQSGLGRRFGVQLLEFTPSANFRELVTTADEMAAHAERSATTGGDKNLREPPSAQQLKYVQLNSIGLFRSLRVEFEPGWTVLLGNNGGGKSTILRAVVLALAGNDPRAVAAGARLLRSGAEHGSVELGIGSARVVTSLVRDGQKVQLTSPQTTVLQAGQVLVLGFPALRGVSTAQVRGPTQAAAADPSVDDVAPLLHGGVDGRLDNLQQWVVNTALRADAAPGGREARMLATFERLLADMVPGGGLSYSHVDRQTWQVILKSHDGDVRFDSVSQGMSAILNWIGILLQRLYDVYPRAQEPEKEAAIVLVDEIDAHLHPDWQRRLVALTREHFPRVQVIASTHSPLLAGAVAHAELRVVERDAASGEIRAERSREDMSGQKAEDILVSSLFKLASTRSPEAEQVLRRYFELFQKLELQPAEKEELDRLSSLVKSLNFGPTAAQRKQIEDVNEKTEQALASVGEADLRALSARLAAAGQRQQGRPAK